MHRSARDFVCVSGIYSTAWENGPELHDEASIIGFSVWYPVKARTKPSCVQIGI